MTKARDLGDNAQNTKPKVINAKGDLIVGTGSDAADRLAVSDNGSTLVADSSASTGLRWQGNFAAGKNRFINGDFNINQRGFTNTLSGSGAYSFDRWAGVFLGTDGTSTFSAETFTPGAAPVAGYESSNYLRIVTSGQTAANCLTLFRQPIEDVRVFAGQTVTISFWAKAASGTPKVAVSLAQRFGTGGSPSAQAEAPAGFVTLSTSWQRYSIVYNVPSISGKTIGTDPNSSNTRVQFFVSAGSDYATNSSSIGIQSNTFDFWGMQIEAGSVATAFQTATGTLAGELAACQRYYVRQGGDSAYQPYGVGIANSGGTQVQVYVTHPVTMRVAPTSIDYSTLGATDSVTTIAATGVTLGNAGKSMSAINLTFGSGVTGWRTYTAVSNNSTSAYLGFSAEL